MKSLSYMLAAAALAVGSAAIAQSSNEVPVDNLPARDDASTEKMLESGEKDRAASRANDTVSRTALVDWAQCLVRGNAGEAGRVLSMDFTSAGYQRAFVMLTDEDKQCRNFRGTLRTPRLLLAGELAEALMARKDVPIGNALAKAAARPATPAFSFTDRVAMCVVRSAPGDVATLFSTARNSSEETAAVQALAVPMGLCAKAAEARKPLSINPAGLRAMLATAAYRSVKDV